MPSSKFKDSAKKKHTEKYVDKFWMGVKWQMQNNLFTRNTTHLFKAIPNDKTLI